MSRQLQLIREIEERLASLKLLVEEEQKNKSRSTQQENVTQVCEKWLQQYQQSKTIGCYLANMPKLWRIFTLNEDPVTETSLRVLLEKQKRDEIQIRARCFTCILSKADLQYFSSWKSVIQPIRVGDVSAQARFELRCEGSYEDPKTGLMSADASVFAEPPVKTTVHTLELHFE